MQATAIYFAKEFKANRDLHDGSNAVFVKAVTGVFKEKLYGM